MSVGAVLININTVRRLSPLWVAPLLRFGSWPVYEDRSYMSTKHVCIHFSLLLAVDEMWVGDLSSCSLDFLLGWTVPWNCELKSTFSPLSCLLWFYHSNRKMRTPATIYIIFLYHIQKVASVQFCEYATCPLQMCGTYKAALTTNKPQSCLLYSLRFKKSQIGEWEGAWWHWHT